MARGLVIACFLVLMFLWPFELPIAMTMHGLARHSLGAWYGILFHATALSMVSIAVIATGRWRERWISGDWQGFVYSLLLYLAVGVAALPISSAEPLETRFSYQQLICGYAAPFLAITAMLALSPKSQSRAWTCFYAGWVAFFCVSFGFLYVSWGAAVEVSPALRDMTLAERLLLWRFSLGEDWNIYGTFVGNSNKTSNYLVVFLLLSVTLLKVGTHSLSLAQRLILFAFWIFACATLVLLFSRAALLLLPLAIVFSGVWTLVSKRVAFVTCAVVGLGLLVVSIVEPRIFQYLLVARFVEDAEANPLGTFVDRFEQWTALAQFLGENPLRAIFGLGTTGYGVLFFNSSEAGTHNFLLDLWAESGVIGLSLFLAFLAVVVFQIATSRKTRWERSVLGAALLILLMLMTREHSVSYLYVTAMGGLCIAVIPYLATVRTQYPERCARQLAFRSQEARKDGHG